MTHKRKAQKIREEKSARSVRRRKHTRGLRNLSDPDATERIVQALAPKNDEDPSVALLGRPEMSQQANLPVRQAIVRHLQAQQGNAYVQRLVDNARTEVPLQRQAEEEEEEAIQTIQRQAETSGLIARDVGEGGTATAAAPTEAPGEAAGAAQRRIWRSMVVMPLVNAAAAARGSPPNFEQAIERCLAARQAASDLSLSMDITADTRREIGSLLSDIDSEVREMRSIARVGIGAHVAARIGGLDTLANLIGGRMWRERRSRP